MDFGYIWDDDKFARVQEKHNVTFAEVLTALEDNERGFEKEDPQDNEERWMWMGRSHTGRILSVICTSGDWGQVIRIITAYDANQENIDEYNSSP